MYLGDWAEAGHKEMVLDFEGLWHSKEDKVQAVLAMPKYRDIEVLLAHYSHECYEGEAFVLYRKDGVLYEVSGSHCSCYGLEGQWEPEETTVSALRHRMAEGGLGAPRWGSEGGFAAELAGVLDSLDT